MLKLWGRVNSSNVKKVRWTCAELDIPYERVDAGLHFGVVNSDEYRAMNPNGMIPVIDDDGFVLWESNAIVRYLCAKNPKSALLARRPAHPGVCRPLDGMAEHHHWPPDWPTLHAADPAARA